MSLFRAGIPALLLCASLAFAAPLAAQAAPAEPAAAKVHAEKQPKAPTKDELTKDQASSLALVSREHPLDPANYKPKDLRNVAGSGHELRKDAASALESLLQSARKNSKSLVVLSAYRSYERQLSLFNGYKARYGTDYAMRISAAAGTSEHQLGLAADIGLSSGQCNLKECFGDTAGGKWLASNAADFGFIIRYPSDGEKITGYKYEPWHLRYIGVDHAKAMAKSKAGTFEDYQATLLKATTAPKTAAPKLLTDAQVKERRESLLVLRFLPPYRDWSTGYDFAR
ncbi:MAG: M15 family metallopeptidase [Micrococcaceae bacterium]|nr:M15 family metallopeptidase [Micrococcaceae bacterium]